MAKLSGYRKLVKWIRVGDDFKKTSTETRAESVIMDNNGTTLVEEMNELKESSIGENLIPYPYYDTTKTEYGITFTDNGDGTITINGTNTKDGEVSFNLGYQNYTIPLQENEKYTFSGGLTSDCLLQMVSYRDKWLWGYGDDTGNGTTITALDNDIRSLNVFFRIVVKKGATVNNLTFKPMFEVGSIAHSYQPYKLSRKSLLDNIDNIETKIDNTEVKIDNIETEIDNKLSNYSTAKFSYSNGTLTITN